MLKEHQISEPIIDDPWQLWVRSEAHLRVLYFTWSKRKIHFNVLPAKI